MRAIILLSPVIWLNVMFVTVENACDNCVSCSVGFWCSQCSSGYYKSHGSCSRCPNSCVTCTKYDCTSCKDRYYGRWCGNSCDTNCVNTTCRKTDGKCDFGCSLGYYQSDYSCVRCSSKIRKCETCTYAYQCTKCASGYFMKKHSDGRFSCNVCSTGKWGYDCQHDCTICTTCDPSNGHCHSCPRYAFGETCQFRCSNGCNDVTGTYVCDKQTGQCLDGCKSGYTGTYCETVDGGWGPWSRFTPCSVSCGEGIKTRSRSCDQPVPKNGGRECVGEKYNTTTCGQLNCSDGNASRALIGGAVGGVALVIILAVMLALVCIFRRRKQRQRCHGGEQVFYANDAPAAETALKFEHSILNQGASRHETDEHEENIIEDNVYAQPDKPKKDKRKDSINIQNEDKTKTSLGKEKREDEERGPQDELYIPALPCKLYQYMEDDDLEEINERNISEMDTTDGIIPDQSEMYYNTGGLIRRRIPVEKLANTVAEKSADEFLKEFKTLTDGLSRDFTAAVKPENKYRNRYNLIYPYDVTRVKLTGESSDYINASYIDGYQQSQTYIACLGPTETATDNFALFWTMVWQQKVEKIVMLTRLLEGKKMKCEQYWPESDSEYYGDITVYRISEVNYAEFSIRNFDVMKGTERHRVCQIHYLAWPDRGVPDDVTSLLEFRHKVDAMPTTLNGPMIVHCSAGIGRTGTYIALDMLIREGSCQQHVDVFGCVNGIRGQRTNLVQNVDQYTFLHDALVHELTLPSQLMSPEHMAWFLTKEGQHELRRQFEHLQTVIEGTADMEAESVEKSDFKTKKRKEADVPGGRHRVTLNTKKPGSSDYINATFVNVNYINVFHESV